MKKINTTRTTSLHTAHTSHRSSSKPAAFDSYTLITQSRNTILSRRYPSCDPPQSTFDHCSTLPAPIHLSAVNRKDRAKLRASRPKPIQRSKPVPVKSKSFDFPVDVPKPVPKKPKPLDLDLIEQGIKKKREEKMDQIMDNIITGHTNFSSYFGTRGSAPNTIFANPTYTTPMFPNIPSPMGGRFALNNSKDAETAPNQIQITIKNEHNGKKNWLFCCRSSKCNIL